MTDFTSLPIPASKTSELSSASTPLAGTETVAVVQGGTTKKVAVSEIAGLAGGGGTPVTMDGSQKTFYVDGVQGAYVVSGGMCTFGVWVLASGNPTLFGNIWSMPLPVTKPGAASYTFIRTYSPLCECYMDNDGILIFSADGAFDSTWVYLYGVYPVSGA